MLLKMLFLAYLWAISERRVEELCNYYIPAKAFVGLGMLDRAPDHSTLTVFKERLEKHGGAEAYAKVFDKIVQQAMAAGVKLDTIQLVHAVHTIANVDNEKDRERHEQGQPSADPDATVVNKGSFRQASRKRLVPVWAWGAHRTVHLALGARKELPGQQNKVAAGLSRR